MGAWGVTARESDSGLDYLHIAKVKCLEPIDFLNFDVNNIMETLKNHIIDVIRRENEPHVKNKERVQEYIDANLPVEYTTVVLLLAECLTEYHQNGEFIIHDYEANTDRKITKFIYTSITIDELLKNLHEMLNPEHWLYQSWFEDNTREEWKSHMKTMCDSLISLKGGIVNE